MNRIKDRFPAPPAMVMEMWIVIMIWVCLCELIGVWFVQGRWAYTTGLILGAVLSCAGAYHMWYMLDKSLGTADEKKAARMVGSGYAIRYALLIALVLILYFTGFGSPFTAFLGYIGMKPAAYLQPSIHRLICSIKRR